MIDRPAPLDLDTVLSPTWLSNVLDEPVAEVHVVEALTLNIASKIRICVEYADGVSNDRPRAFCVKGYFKPESASFASLGQQEVRFYRDLAPLTTIERPECVYGGIDETTGHGVIVMKDLIEAGCTFLTPLSPYSVDKAAATVVELAKLHHVDPSSSPDGIDWLAPKLGVTLDYIGELVSREHSPAPQHKLAALSRCAAHQRRRDAKLAPARTSHPRRRPQHRIVRKVARSRCHLNSRRRGWRPDG